MVGKISQQLVIEQLETGKATRSIAELCSVATRVLWGQKPELTGGHG
jgi:hypothetical protein